MESIGHKISLARHKRKYTQDALAKTINIDQHLLSDIENDKKSPTWSIICNIAEALGVPILDLLPNVGLNIVNNTFQDNSGIQSTYNFDHILLRDLLDRIIKLEAKLVLEQK